MSSQPIVQWNYMICFDAQGSFLITFFTSFWKRVHKFERNCEYTIYVCFDHWLRRYDHTFTNKVLLDGAFLVV